MSDSEGHPLVLELLHWQEVMSLRYHQLLESVTDLDLTDAERHLGMFRRLFQNVVAFSDQHFEPMLTGSDDEQRLLRADREILGRTLGRVEQGLAELGEIRQADKTGLRSAMVDRLEILVRFNNMLLRHQQRQRELIAPVIEQTMDRERGKALAERLGGLMQPLKAH